MSARWPAIFLGLLGACVTELGCTGTSTPPRGAAPSPGAPASDPPAVVGAPSPAPSSVPATGAGAGCPSSADGGCSTSEREKCADGAQRADGGECAATPARPAPVAGPRDPAAIAAARIGAMKKIPGGSFKMGSEEAGQAPDQAPVHAVTLQTFELDATEVTVEAYEKCVEAGGCRAPTKERASTEPSAETLCNYAHASRKRHPVNCVSYEDAESYCTWAGKRLPTEAEWEYAARGRGGRLYPWGSKAPADQLCSRSRSPGISCEVGSFPDGNSPQGISDLAGNVSEWTATPYCPYSDAKCAATSRARRGGSFYNHHESDFRGAGRSHSSPETRHSSIGFRCAR